MRGAKAFGGAQIVRDTLKTREEGDSNQRLKPHVQHRPLTLMQERWTQEYWDLLKGIWIWRFTAAVESLVCPGPLTPKNSTPILQGNFSLLPLITPTPRMQTKRMQVFRFRQNVTEKMKTIFRRGPKNVICSLWEIEALPEDRRWANVLVFKKGRR